MKTSLIAAVGAACLLLTAPFAVAQDKPTDPQIAHIAYSAGVIDIEAAKLALEKTTNEDVAAFARSMQQDHEAVNVQALELAEKLNVTPEDNPTSQALTKAADEKRAELGKLDGAAFDKAYIDNEVAYHKAVISAVEGLLIPEAENAELKALLQNVVPALQAHLEHAEMLQSQLNGK